MIFQNMTRCFLAYNLISAGGMSGSNKVVHNIR